MRWITRKKECPTCRAPCPSRRALVPDPEFDAIIAHVYPDLAVYDQHQTQLMERLMSSTSTVALTDSINEGMRQQYQSRSRGRPSLESTTTCEQNQNSVISQEMLPNERWLKLDLVSEADQSLPQIRKRYITVPPQTTAMHVSRYVLNQLIDMDSTQYGGMLAKDIIISQKMKRLQSMEKISPLCIGATVSVLRYCRSTVV